MPMVQFRKTEILPASFFGLKESSRSLIYGELRSHDRRDYHIFHHEDRMGGKKQINDHKKIAVSELNSHSKDVSSIKAPLFWKKSHKVGEVEMNVPPDLKNKEISVTVNGSISVRLLEEDGLELLLKKAPKRTFENK